MIFRSHFVHFKITLVMEEMVEEVVNFSIQTKTAT